MYNNITSALITLAVANSPKWGASVNPICHLCKDGKLPGEPWGAAAILVPGEPDQSRVYTCEELHKMGRAGQITGQMCKVTQYYMQQVCECREFKKPKRPRWTVRPRPTTP